MTRYFFLACGGALMVATYFIGEWLLPSIGLAGALAELLPNVIQAVGGGIGGWILFRVLILMLQAEDD